jgi:hypothetical protein
MRTIAPLTIATCLACNGHLDVFQLDAGNDAGGQSQPDTGYGIAIIPADILFVVDDSGSMADEQQNLADNFSSFIDQTALWAEYRIGVVSTDITSQGGQRGGNQSFTYSPTYPFVLSDFDMNTCASTGIDHGCFRGPDPALRLIDGAQLTRDEQIAAFADNVRVGTCGGGVEGGLEAMLEALRQMGPGGCNEGFLRSYANLVIIIVSDEDDTSARPIEEIVNELGTFKPFSQIRIATVAGTIGGEPSDCGPGVGAACGSVCDNMPPGGSMQACQSGDDCPSGEHCDINRACENDDLLYWSACRSCSFYNAPDCCSATAGNRYVEFARAVEQRVHDVRPEFPIANCQSLGTRAACLTDTICQASFGDTLARIARELVLVDL